MVCINSLSFYVRNRSQNRQPSRQCIDSVHFDLFVFLFWFSINELRCDVSHLTDVSNECIGEYIDNSHSKTFVRFLC